MVGTTSAGSSPHPFGYTGRRWDPDLGLYYYRARWYDPQLGTFLQTDPIGSLDYVNLYAYVGLEPGNGTDPSGMKVGDRYRTLNEAGTQAVRDINPISIRQNREYAGWVYKNLDGTFSYTEAKRGLPASVEPESRSILRNEEGMYHTHGGYDPAYDGESFSVADKEISQHFDEPSFLGTPSGEIKIFDPSKVDNPSSTTDERVTTVGTTNDGRTSAPLPEPKFRPYNPTGPFKGP
jgi:RHS repeat-associated protein